MARSIRLAAAVAVLCAAAVLASDDTTISKDEFKARRARLQQQIDGVLVLAGWTEGPDEVYRTYQEANLLYLTGFTEPGALLLITPKAEVLFLPARNERRERYAGKRFAAGDPGVAAQLGFTEVLPVAQFEQRLALALGDGPNVYALAGTPFAAKLKALVPMRDVRDAAPLVGKLRMKKSAAEIAAIQHATDVSMKAHLESWKRLQPGNYEYNAVAAFTKSLMDEGCERHAYEPIFGSGPNSVILHYDSNRRRMDSGDVIVIDAGASCANYTSDITRTLPVAGKFTERQRQVYEVVLGAQRAAIEAARPGVTPARLAEIARKYMDDHGGFGKYLLHGISHHVGLDVHDPGAANVPLEKDHVVTIEPGIYIAAENLGVRIEDVILITEGAPKVLSAPLAKEIADVEKAMVR